MNLKHALAPLPLVTDAKLKLPLRSFIAKHRLRQRVLNFIHRASLFLRVGNTINIPPQKFVVLFRWVFYKSYLIRRLIFSDGFVWCFHSVRNGPASLENRHPLRTAALSEHDRKGSVNLVLFRS